jgi:hypothetical protein
MVENIQIGIARTTPEENIPMIRFYPITKTTALKECLLNRSQ